MQYNSWRLFLGAISLPTFAIATVTLTYPESPKFLVSQGKTDEALAILRTIYAVNTGRDKSEFPVSTKKKIIFIFQIVLSDSIMDYVIFFLNHVPLLGEGTSLGRYIRGRKGQAIVIVGYADGIVEKYLVAIAHHCIATSFEVCFPVVDDLFYQHVRVSVS